MALDSFNTSPTVYWLGPPTGHETESDTDPPGRQQGRGWEWVQDHGSDAIDILNSSLCLINPKRAGCPGDSNMQPVVVNQGVPIWAIVALALVFLLVLLLIFKKSK